MIRKLGNFLKNFKRTQLVGQNQMELDSIDIQDSTTSEENIYDEDECDNQ